MMTGLSSHMELLTARPVSDVTCRDVAQKKLGNIAASRQINCIFLY